MNSITEEFIKSQIANVEYHQLTGTTITISVITLKSGFTVTGESACVDPNNFDVEIGNKIAYENAFDKLWQLFGFELKQKIGGDWMYRLHRERSELAERIDALKEFLNSKEIITICEHNVLKQQEKVMSQYLAILDARLAQI
ncbi:MULTISPECIES: Gp49 family protein [Haemophilus]|uniref:Phage protein n=1 Tax=Haemophilus aegyptius TaxID=197575 RepID=A0ABY1VT06_HAEAE|nr:MULTISPECIES: Gp49 family protein [Haemophilus]EGF19231.1 hypothetical protein HMPREF9095_0059 [Haemophilus aegyptius ATCC 11116]OBX83007.1 hypothetical protein A9520_00965 [Haemophilus aegyptius]TMQ42505.1 hypothetical protein AO054_07435 [Haemophilus influenzae biotype aegyptius]UAK83088.1 hypothetical protein K8O83_02775 [Haemophilus aegyptius]SQH36294.1 Uncharacterised protein [Haemophilus aegyptius]